MENSQELASLASEIHRYEQEGVQLSADWYHFKSSKPDDLRKLETLFGQSLEALQKLSRALDRKLEQDADDSNRDQFQYAYNLVQELIQSRDASQTMLSDVMHQSQDQPKEYYRALALKEKAAAEQAAKLHDVILRNLH